MMARWLIIVASIVLAGCGDATEGQPEGEKQLLPSDPLLASLYQRSCRNCHAIVASGAPQTGDALAWEPRLAKGMSALVDNVIAGYGTMPRGGLCPQCTREQQAALIEFMATPAQPANAGASE